MFIIITSTFVNIFFGLLADGIVFSLYALTDGPFLIKDSVIINLITILAVYFV